MDKAFEILLEHVPRACGAGERGRHEPGQATCLLESHLLPMRPAEDSYRAFTLQEGCPLRTDVTQRAAAASRGAVRIAIERTQVARGDAPQEAQEWANSIVYALLLEGLAAHAADLSDFLLLPQMSGLMRDLDARIRVINCATAHQLIGGQARVDQVLDSLSWEGCWPDFELVVAALRLDFDRAAHVMRAIGGTGRLLGRQAYEAWPSLAAFRQSAAFAHAHHDIFGPLAF